MKKASGGEAELSTHVPPQETSLNTVHLHPDAQYKTSETHTVQKASQLDVTDCSHHRHTKDIVCLLKHPIRSSHFRVKMMSKSVSVWRKLLSIYTEYVDLLEWHTETNVQKKLLKASIQYILFSTACGQCTYSKHFGKCACTSHQSDFQL